MTVKSCELSGILAPTWTKTFPVPSGVPGLMRALDLVHCHCGSVCGLNPVKFDCHWSRRKAVPFYANIIQVRWAPKTGEMLVMTGCAIRSR